MQTGFQGAKSSGFTVFGNQQALQQCVWGQGREGGAQMMLSTVTAEVSGEVAPRRSCRPSASPFFSTASPVLDSLIFFQCREDRC